MGLWLTGAVEGVGQAVALPVEGECDGIVADEVAEHVQGLASDTVSGNFRHSAFHLAVGAFGAVAVAVDDSELSGVRRVEAQQVCAGPAGDVVFAVVVEADAYFSWGTSGFLMRDGTDDMQVVNAGLAVASGMGDGP